MGYNTLLGSTASSLWYNWIVFIPLHNSCTEKVYCGLKHLQRLKTSSHYEDFKLMGIQIFDISVQFGLLFPCRSSSSGKHLWSFLEKIQALLWICPVL